MGAHRVVRHNISVALGATLVEGEGDSGVSTRAYALVPDMPKDEAPLQASSDQRDIGANAAAQDSPLEACVTDTYQLQGLPRCRPNL